MCNRTYRAELGAFFHAHGRAPCFGKMDTVRSRDRAIAKTGRKIMTDQARRARIGLRNPLANRLARHDIGLMQTHSLNLRGAALILAAASVFSCAGGLGGSAFDTAVCPELGGGAEITW